MIDGQERYSAEDDKHRREYGDLLRALPSLTFEGREFALGAHIPFEVVPRAFLVSLATDLPTECSTERYRVTSRSVPIVRGSLTTFLKKTESEDREASAWATRLIFVCAWRSGRGLR